ncbi:MAG: hypothetical protein QOG00_250 [Pyrinomonadaceae bacterium]|nr:hypothetical protein [Pyrinomonadaceae bacterium]
MSTNKPASAGASTAAAKDTSSSTADAARTEAAAEAAADKPALSPLHTWFARRISNHGNVRVRLDNELLLVNGLTDDGKLELEVREGGAYRYVPLDETYIDTVMAQVM